MNPDTQNISVVPTNIITGFLGVGKTSAILHLLKTKPAKERWAVLVNEFGEIGVDGSLFRGRHSEKKGIFIQEVPGGCMCCAAGLPMQMALGRLLIHAKPDRLLIEPTGLGHPVEVLQVLTDAQFCVGLSIHKILTLVDARQLADPRYTEHTTFNQQISIADVIVGNKQDLYEQEDNARLEHYIKENELHNVKVIYTQQGAIDSELLQGPTTTTSHTHKHRYERVETDDLSESPIPECGYIKAVNQGEGFESVGWRFNSTKIFNHKKLINFLSGLDAERMKAVFITENGVFGYNLTSDTLTEIELDDCLESRIEMIAIHIDDQWETELLACLEANV